MMNDRYKTHCCTIIFRDKLNLAQTLFGTLFGELTFPFGISYQGFLCKPVFTGAINLLLRSDNNTRWISMIIQGYRQRTIIRVTNGRLIIFLTGRKTLADVHEFDVTFLLMLKNFNPGKVTHGKFKFCTKWSIVVTMRFLRDKLRPFQQMTDCLTDNPVVQYTYATGNALMARLNYTLMNKYIITGTWRRDGYSAFGQKHPYAEFPSAAIGWRISEEEFFNVKLD